MTIFEAIREDHDEQRKLMGLLLETQGDSTRRLHLFATLKELLTRHADSEERHFYVPLLNDDRTQEKARHGIAEHHEIDELIEKIEDTDPSSSGWLITARKLCETINHHLDEEEHEIFQMAGKVLNEAEKTSLAKDYSAAMSDPHEQSAGHA